MLLHRATGEPTLLRECPLVTYLSSLLVTLPTSSDVFWLHRVRRLHWCCSRIPKLGLLRYLLPKPYHVNGNGVCLQPFHMVSCLLVPKSSMVWFCPWSVLGSNAWFWFWHLEPTYSYALWFHSLLGPKPLIPRLFMCQTSTLLFILALSSWFPNPSIRKVRSTWSRHW